MTGSSALRLLRAISPFSAELILRSTLGFLEGQAFSLNCFERDMIAAGSHYSMLMLFSATRERRWDMAREEIQRTRFLHRLQASILHRRC